LDRPFILAIIICSHTAQPAVGRFVRTGRTYNLIGASKQRPGSVLPEDGKKPTRSAFGVSPSYRCPYCGASDYVQCGRCNGLGCWDPSWEIFRCQRCGNSGPVDGTIDRLTGLGGG
jgi:hypothetical protein